MTLCPEKGSSNYKTNILCAYNFFMLSVQSEVVFSMLLLYLSSIQSSAVLIQFIVGMLWLSCFGFRCLRCEGLGILGI